MQQRIHDRMIEQVFADRQVGEDRDAQRLQQRRGTDAGALQDGRRVNGAGAEDHLAPRRRRVRLAVHADPDRAGVQPVAFEFYSFDQRMADDVEIVAAARRLQIAVIGGDAASSLAVDGVGRDAGPRGRIVVVVPAIAEAERGLAQRPVDVAPIRHRSAIDRDRAANCRDRPRPENSCRSRACRNTAASPSHPQPVAALRFPAIEIVGHGADRDLAVDGGAAAHGAAAPQQPRLPAARFAAPAVSASGNCHRRSRASGSGCWMCSGVVAVRRSCPASSSSTRCDGSSLSRAASVAPAEPPPMMIVSYS